jgi:hypothetical protein
MSSSQGTQESYCLLYWSLAHSILHASMVLSVCLWSWVVMGNVQQICLFSSSGLSFTIGKYAEYMYRDARAENGLPNPVLSSRSPVMQALEQKVGDIWVVWLLGVGGGILRHACKSISRFWTYGE